MTQYAHKGQILPLVNQMIPIDKQTTFHASYDYHLNGYNQGDLVSPLGRYPIVADFNNGTSANQISASIANLPTGANPRTIECWVMVTAAINAGSPGIIGYPYTGTSTGATYNIFEINFSTSGNGHFGIHLWGSQVYGTTTVAMNTWYHVAATYNGTTVQLYVNGISEASLSASLVTSLNSGTYNFNIRRAVNPSDGTPSCYISDVRVWNIARSASQIQSTMNSQLSGTETGLLAYFKLNESEGLTVFDSTPNGNSGKRQGTVPFYSTSDIVATVQKNQGKFGGAVSIEPDTTNLFTSPYLDNNSNTTTGTTTLTQNTWTVNGTTLKGVTLNQGVAADIISISIPHNQPSTSPTFSVWMNSTVLNPLKAQVQCVVGGVTYYLQDGKVWGTDSSQEVHDIFSGYTTTGQWQRVSYTFPAFPSGTLTSFTMSGGWYRQAASMTVSIANAQLEQLGYPTSFVVGSRPLGKLWYPKELINLPAFTVGCWFKIPYLNRVATNMGGIDGGDWYDPIIELAEQTAGTASFSVVCGPQPSGWNRRINLRWNSNSSGDHYGTTAIQDNTWYHMVLTYDGSNYKVYMNGTLDITVANTTIPTVASDSVLMVGGGFEGKPFTWIDELRIESRAISSDEAAAWGASGLHYNYLDYSYYVD